MLYYWILVGIPVCFPASSSSFLRFSTSRGLRLCLHSDLLRWHSRVAQGESSFGDRGFTSLLMMLLLLLLLLLLMMYRVSAAGDILTVSLRFPHRLLWRQFTARFWCRRILSKYRHFGIYGRLEIFRLLCSSLRFIIYVYVYLDIYILLWYEENQLFFSIIFRILCWNSKIWKHILEVPEFSMTLSYYFNLKKTNLFFYFFG